MSNVYENLVDEPGLAAFWNEASDDIDQRIAEALNNGGGGGSTADEDYGEYTDIVKKIKAGEGSTALPIGTPFTADWNDGTTDYSVRWNPALHTKRTLEDGSEVNVAVVQMHHCLPFDTEFSPRQAFLAAKTSLPAGTYYMARSSTTLKFTLTKAVPAGGQLCLYENSFAANKKVASYASPADTTPIETVTMTSGSGGTNLGTFQDNAGSIPGASGTPTATSVTISGTTYEYYGLNAYNRVLYGNNRWLHSAIRQYLNASGTDWWEPKTVYDRPPSYVSREGFLTKLDADLVKTLKPIKRETALNYVCDGGTTAEPVSDVTYDKVALPSWEEHFLTVDQNYGGKAGLEGEAFDYWKNVNGTGSSWAAGSTHTEYIQYDLADQSTARTVWMRSANRSYAYNVALVYSHGHCGNNGAYNSYRVAPVLAIG